MEINIDETELARLEELVTHYESVVTLNNVSIPHQIIKSVPALVAEVRRLREKIEAWEWWEEADLLYGDTGLLFQMRLCAIDELYATLTAAREAVHADRE